jgi:hypothetical protein
MNTEDLTLQNIISYNFNDFNTNLIHYFGKDKLIDDLSTFFINFINSYKNKSKTLKIFQNANLGFIIKKRFSILFEPIPITLNYSSFSKKWHKQFIENNKLNDIDDLLIMHSINSKKLKENIFIYDWLCYLIYTEFCKKNNIDEQSFIKYYSQHNNDKIYAFIHFAEITNYEIIFLQNINQYNIRQINKKIYDVYYKNNMAILINKRIIINTYLTINEDIFEQFMLIVENSDIKLISAYISDLEQFNRLVFDIKDENRECIVCFSSGIDLTEEKYELYDLNLSKTLNTTNLDLCGFYHLYGNLGETNGRYDFVLSNIKFNQSKICNYIKTEHSLLEIKFN